MVTFRCMPLIVKIAVFFEGGREIETAVSATRKTRSEW
jgi:hypothetical protein